jgi:hypothetical protein
VLETTITVGNVDVVDFPVQENSFWRKAKHRPIVGCLPMSNLPQCQNQNKCCKRHGVSGQKRDVNQRSEFRQKLVANDYFRGRNFAAPGA